MKICIIGLGYVGLPLAIQFARSGAVVTDPYVSVIKQTREHPQWAGKESNRGGQSTIASFDLVLIATNHSTINYYDLGKWSRCIVDTRNAMAPVPKPAGKVWRA